MKMSGLFRSKNIFLIGLILGVMTVGFCSVVFAENLYVDEAYGNSPYNIGENETWDNVYVGRVAGSSGEVNHTGGWTSGIESYLYLGYLSGAQGTYNLGSGELSSYWTSVGYQGIGYFNQTGGTHSSKGMYVGCYNGTGTYELSDGELFFNRGAYGGTYVGYQGDGYFIQTGGTHSTDEMNVGYSNGMGTYELSVGELSSVKTYVGREGDGYFNQTGGTHSTDGMYLGRGNSSNGTYELSAGELISTGGTYLGSTSGTGCFTQTGGMHRTDSLYVGCGLSRDNGTYTMFDGRLEVNSLIVGYGTSDGVFDLTGSDAEIDIGESLFFGENSIFTAVPGSTIHMTGSQFDNRSIDPGPDGLSGLNDLTMIFEGGAGDIDPFEVAGQDFGAVMEGFDYNFALDTLQLGGTDVGFFQLVDSFDNQPGWEGAEALYVKNLFLGEGSYLDLNDLNLYYLNFTDNGGSITGGIPLHVVPEPVSMILFPIGVGVFGLVKRRRKRHVFTRI